MEIYSSDEDIDNEIAHLLVVPDPRLPRQFATRDFDEDVSDKTFRERYRVPREVVNLLEEKLSADLKHATRRNQGLSSRFRLKSFFTLSAQTHFFTSCATAMGSAQTLFSAQCTGSVTFSTCWGKTTSNGQTTLRLWLTSSTRLRRCQVSVVLWMEPMCQYIPQRPKKWHLSTGSRLIPSTSWLSVVPTLRFSLSVQELLVAGMIQG